MVPITKPGSEKDTAARYRPISILPIASKVIERHVKEVLRLEEHLSNHAPIYDSGVYGRLFCYVCSYPGS